MEEKYTYLSVIAILAIILLVFFISSHNTKQDLKEKIASLNTNLKQKDASIANLSAELDILKKKAGALSSQNSQLSAENAELLKEFNNLLAEVEKTRNALDDFDRKIKSSLEWFNLNTNLDNLNDYSVVEKDLRTSCLKIDDEKKCWIRTSCLNYVNNESGFSYQYDNMTRSKEDSLQGLQEIYNNKGGDCEDFSLLAMAELNYLNSYCADKRGEETTYVAFTEAEGKKHFVEFTDQYYIKDAEDYTFYLKNYYVACGNFPKNRWELYGHCLLAFSDIPLNESVYDSLSNALLIEPQTGEIVFDLRRQSDIQVPKNSHVEGSFISLVFDSRDMYIFNVFDGKYRWKSYSMFSQDVTDLKKGLGKFII